jgi:hypothetical protein
VSVEKLVRASLLEAVGGRILAETIDIAGRVFHALGNGLDEVSDGLFYIELDGARRYENLTGVNLGDAAGNPQRHALKSESQEEDE